jgi:peptidoglycan/xylan/chitin deacetylase (PgdA/CDA1 family)
MKAKLRWHRLVILAITAALSFLKPAIAADTSVAFNPLYGGNVYLYESDATRSYVAGLGGNYENLLKPWRDLLLQKKRAHKILSKPHQLTAIRENGVLILPSALALSDAEKSAVLAFRDKGGGVLATWAAGTRNERGDWLGWQFLNALGATVVGEHSNDSDARQLILTGESPVSHTHPAGQRIWLNKTPESILRLKSESIAGRLMNWARIPDEARRDEGAIVYTEASQSGGRSVVFAFAESVWAEQPLLNGLYIDDTLKWLMHEPVIVKSAWPEGKRAAQVIEMDTEDGFANALNFNAMMKAANLRPTYYILTSVAKQFPEVLSQLAKDGELAYHGDIHTSFKGQPAATQEHRLAAMRSELTALLPSARNVNGFRAPTEGYDAQTERLLQQIGIRHHAADPQRSEGRLPLFAQISGTGIQNDLIVLPRTQRDDINLASLGLSVTGLSQLLIDDFDHALKSGALGFLSVHSQNFESSSPLSNAFPTFLSHIQKNRAQMWFATAGQVAQWWRDRERVRFESTFNGSRLELNITVIGDTPVENVSFVAMLPQKYHLPVIKSTKPNIELPTVTRIDDFRSNLNFKRLQAGNYRFIANFVSK